MQNPFDPSLANPPLRDALEEISNRYDPKDVAKQIPDVKHLRRRHDHAIRLIEAVAEASAGPGQYNCYMYALNVHRSPAVTDLLARRNIAFGNDFMAWLIESGRLTPISADAAAAGDIVLYSDRSGPKHAGRWDGKAVQSKWGLGHLWSHRVFEVRSSYGDAAQAYQRVDSAAMAQWFVEYADGSAD